MAQELLSEGLNEIKQPIWESENAELYSSSPGLSSFVIWEHNPNEEGVKLYAKFDNYDPLPHHYYKSDTEYNAAMQKYANGGYPDKLIYVNSYPHWETKSRQAAPEIIVFQPMSDQVEEFDQVKAA